MFQLESSTDTLRNHCLRLISQETSPAEAFRHHPLFRARIQRLRQLPLCSEILAEPLIITLPPGAASIPVDPWTFVTLNVAAANCNTKLPDPIKNRTKCTFASEFLSGTEVLQQRAAQGSIEPQETLSVMSPTAAASSRNKLQFWIGKENNVASSFDRTNLASRAEIPQDILELVKSMRMLAEEFIKESDIAGLLSVKKLIKDKIIHPIKRPDLHHGLHQPPKGILLFGPPGTGKTMLAKWIASESGATFFDVTPSALISKYHGETETVVKTLFAVAEQSRPAIIFIDEIDSLLGRRKDNDDDAGIRMKNQILQMMDGVQTKSDSMVIVVGATNRPDMLDEAATRRLTKRVLIPLPDLEARIGQLKKLLTKHQIDLIEEKDMKSSTDSAFTIEGAQKTVTSVTEDEFRKIAQQIDGWSGSDIKSLCAKAADYPYDEAVMKYGGVDNIPNSSVFRPITYCDFLLALKEVHSSTLDPMYSAKLHEWANKHGCG